jgi:hypothetical protein
MLDIGTARENPFKVNPLPLDINPDVCAVDGYKNADVGYFPSLTEENMNPIELLLPRTSLS